MEEYPLTPELDKMQKLIRNDDPTLSKSQIIGFFLDWLSSQGYVIARWEVNPGAEGGEELIRVHKDTTELLAEYYELDPCKIEAEKRAILDYVRRPG